jgi:hypothetical protein
MSFSKDKHVDVSTCLTFSDILIKGSLIKAAFLLYLPGLIF